MIIQRFSVAPVATVFLFLLVGLSAPGAGAQTFPGTNQPGTTRDIPITIGPTVTNLSIVINGSASAYSHLLLKRGSVPSDTSFDFLAAANGSGNALHLTRPDLATTNYVIRVRTPAASLAHTYTVTVSSNQTDLGSLAKPVTKTVVSGTQGQISANTWQYFRVDVPTNISGWKLSLSASNSVQPDLFIQRNQAPTTTAFLKRSQSQTNDVIAFAGNELSPGVYVVGVYYSSGSGPVVPFTLQTELLSFTTLTWDPGTSHAGSAVYSHSGTNAGDYYFRITTQNSTVGGWRTALNVLSGEAHLYLSRGTAPTVAGFQFRSERAGSDGFVLRALDFNPGEDWYVLVRAQAGAQWTLLTGEPFVTNLGTAASDNSSGSGPVIIGPEGMRFFRTSMPANAIAWRLGLNGSTNTIFVRSNAVPVLAQTDLTQSAQMLVVPSYLAGGRQYFVGVAGNPGATINLDSRLHGFVDLPFVASHSASFPSYGYTTYRVQVPVDQLAWQVNVVVSEGNPNVAVRRNFVPNEFNNDAYSEVGGAVTDSITLVPPTLSDGTFYVTVYSTNTHAFTLQTGTPVITDIPFASTTLNTDTNRAGWRFFRVSDINQQLGALGWDLFITNHAPGTRIALRRNSVPGIWNFRNPNQQSSGFHDALSTGEFLQRPGHQADVWYVGIYNPGESLGPFTLVTRPLTADPLAFNSGSVSRSAVDADKWQYFRVDVPANALGWDVRLINVTGGSPKLVIRRELLPTLVNGNLQGIGFAPPVTLTNWPSGNQWLAAKDWTERDFSIDGSLNQSGRILTLGMGRPLEPGSYYVGVIGDRADANPVTYTLQSRGVGPGLALPVIDLPYAGGSNSTAGLAPRDVAFYRVVIASNTPSWKVKLSTSLGDSMLAVARGSIPNISALNTTSATNVFTPGKKMRKAGNEHFLLLPSNGQPYLWPGEYYLAVAGEGTVDAGFPTRIGTGTSSYTLQSLGPLPELDLGLLTAGDLIHLGELEGGESAAFHFSTAEDLLGFEVSLENRTGNPAVVTRGGLALADPGAPSSGGGGVAQDPYGNEGGQTTVLQASTGLISVANPAPNETLMVKARVSGGTHPDASYTMRIRRLVPTTLAFDGGSAVVQGQSEPYRYFRVDVPADAVGWDVRIVNVTAGLPALIVARDVLGLNIPPGLELGTAATWASGDRVIAGPDWTSRPLSTDGLINEDKRILTAGMGRPLVPGTYYVAVYNGSAGAAPMNYQVVSRGIGGGYSVPVVDLPFAGGSVTNSALPAREAAYYRVVLPSGVSSWQTRLETLSGDAMLLVLSNTIPNIRTGRPGMAGKSNSKSGNEHYVLLPANPASSLEPVTNYLAVVSEGMVPTNANRIGAGSSAYIVQSRGELPVTDLGVAGTADLVRTDTLEGGEARAYQFTVPAGVSSLETLLENSTANPVMVLKAGALFPNPGAASTGGSVGTVGAEDYGNQGGYTLTAADGNANSRLITIANPAAGVYTLMVKARGVSSSYTNAQYTLRVRAANLGSLAFDGGALTVTNQPAGTWKYFRVDVPPTALGWDVRLVNVGSGAPQMVVRRDVLPESLTAPFWSNPSTSTNWPSTNQWRADKDWTRRSLPPGGTSSQDGRILAMGMGRPLVPGTYFIGVINSTGTNAMTYTVQSRGIGDGFSIPVADLAFNNGSASVVDLQPREAAYYRVTLPTNTPAWKVRVAATKGDAMFVVLKDCLPNVDTGQVSSPIAGKSMQKAGNEHFILLPAGTQSHLAAGVYYLAVVSEGVNPAANQIGADSSSFMISSEGSPLVPDLGILGASDLVRSDTIEGGESKLYRFTVPEGVQSIEARFEGRVGNPFVAVRSDDKLVDPGANFGSVARETYGNEGGAVPNEVNATVVSVPNAVPGTYTLAVKARVSGTQFPDASYTLRVRQVPVPDLNFTAEQNTNGLQNTASGLLLDNQRAFYRVEVPTNVAGVPVIGWQLDLSQSSGLATARARKDLLPADAFTIGMPFTAASAVIAPPFLTPGTWFVEVRGSNTTSFSLASRSLALQRPAWIMPAPGQPVTTPGVTAPTFGDSGVDTNGVPLPGDQGIDLEQGYYHYYAVIVPTNNAGLMRAQLEAISGNPDLYLRTNQVPTYSHRSDGQNGTLVERVSTGTTTEYPNWVPVNGRTDVQLKSGVWYLAVRAVGNANARYRLRLSTGNIQNLDLAGGSYSGQIVAGGDWRYYRVQIPEAAPVNWSVTFSQQAGDVVLHVRDTIPPGNGLNNTSGEYKDWFTDGKSPGTVQAIDAVGTYTFSVPPIRPGSVYYLGFRAKNDATFSVSSSVSGGTIPVLPTLDFYTGSVSTNLPPSSSLAFRIFAPPEALRWKHTSSHDNSVKLFLENGNPPAQSPTDDWRSSVANSSLDQGLTGWPWVPNVNYFLLVTNTGAVSQPFSLALNGVGAGSVDDDGDGMPDSWEILYFGNTQQVPGGDFDGDGVTNLEEYLEGTDPMNSASLRPRLVVLASNGSVEVTPGPLTNYAFGTLVSLSATPLPGFEFTGWSGSASGLQNPLSLVMDANKTISASFKSPGDDFDRRILISGFSTTASNSNALATREAEEPDHGGVAGNHSVWWTWVAPFSASVNLSASTDGFVPALAVYTGTALADLDALAADVGSGGPSASQVTFPALAGREYHFAVDGVGGGAGAINLSLTMPDLLMLISVVRLPDGSFGFDVSDQAGNMNRIEGSTNLVDWVPLTPYLQSSGMLRYLDPEASTLPKRFYRAVRQ